MSEQDFEFYETAEAFTRYLMDVLRRRVDGGIHGRVCCEPCVGNGAIVRAVASVPHLGVPTRWATNDLDTRWAADRYASAANANAYPEQGVDWVISNPPFSEAVPIISQALVQARIGVAMYLRVSIHEVLKAGERRTWFAEHPPAGVVFLPRFAHQRSRTKGIWSTDSLTSCWVIWAKVPQFIEYAPESVLEELERETPAYREQMDALNGLTGSEVERQIQWKVRWATPCV